MNRRLLRWLLPCSTVFLLSQGSVGAEQSQVVSDPVVRLLPAQSGNFQDALQALAAQAHVTFVAEGRPLHLTLSDADRPHLPEAGGPLSQAAEKLAAAYDYDVARQGNVFLLTKRYTDPEDLPGVTLTECLQSLEDVRRVTGPFNPRVPPDRYGVRQPLVGDLVASLTPQQLWAMAGNTSGTMLRVASLTPEQQAQVWRVVLYFYVQIPLEPMERGFADLKEAVKPDTKLAFRWEDIAGLHIFGYVLPASVTGHSGFQPLSNPNNRVGYDPQGTVAILMTPHPIIGPDKIPHLPNDPTDPRPAAGTEKKVEAKSQTVGIGEAVQPRSTIADIVGALNARRGAGPLSAVDASLQSKPITVVNESRTSPGDILKAMAVIYGLRVKTEADGTQRLTRRLFQISGDVTGVPEAIRRVFPLPFLRALHSDQSDDLADQYRLYVARSYRGSARQEGEGGPDSQDNAQPNTDFQRLQWIEEKRRRQNQQMRDYLPALRNVAVRRLRLWAEPLIKAAPSGQVPLSSAPADEQQAFATVTLVQFLQSLQPLLSQHVPEYVTHFDQLYLRGGLEADERGNRHFGFLLSLPTPDGERMQGGGPGIGIPLSLKTLPFLEP